jgi:hypothetical protein
MTYEGTRGSAIGQRDKGKHVLDIPSSSVTVLKAEWHEAVLLQGHRLVFSDDADAPEWVTYQYSIPPSGTLPDRFGNRAGATADSSVGISCISNGSRLYELNHWMWHYGRRQPCRVKLSRGVKRD